MTLDSKLDGQLGSGLRASDGDDCGDYYADDGVGG